MNRLIPIAFFALVSWQLDSTAATPDFMLVEIPAVAPSTTKQDETEAAYTQWRADVIAKGTGTRAVVTFNLDSLADRYWLSQCQTNGWDYFSHGKTKRWEKPRVSRCIVAGSELVHEGDVVKVKREVRQYVSAPVVVSAGISYSQPVYVDSAPAPVYAAAPSQTYYEPPSWTYPQYSVCGAGGCP